MEQAAMQRKQMDKAKKLILWTGYSGQPADYQRPALFLVLAGRRKGEKAAGYIQAACGRGTRTAIDGESQHSRAYYDYRTCRNSASGRGSVVSSRPGSVFR